MNLSTYTKLNENLKFVPNYSAQQWVNFMQIVDPRKMESQPGKFTIIEVKKKFERLVTENLLKKNFVFEIIPSENPKTSKIKIHNLDPEEAFRLGVKVQIQLVDGDQLI